MTYAELEQLFKTLGAQETTDTYELYLDLDEGSFSIELNDEYCVFTYDGECSRSYCLEHYFIHDFYTLMKKAFDFYGNIKKEMGEESKQEEIKSVLGL